MLKRNSHMLTFHTTRAVPLRFDKVCGTNNSGCLYVNTFQAILFHNVFLICFVMWDLTAVLDHNSPWTGMCDVGDGKCLEFCWGMLYACHSFLCVYSYPKDRPVSLHGLTHTLLLRSQLLKRVYCMRLQPFIEKYDFKTLSSMDVFQCIAMLKHGL